jgi:hypothetical protein
MAHHWNLQLDGSNIVNNTNSKSFLKCGSWVVIIKNKWENKFFICEMDCNKNEEENFFDPFHHHYSYLPQVTSNGIKSKREHCFIHQYHLLLFFNPQVYMFYFKMLFIKINAKGLTWENTHLFSSFENSEKNVIYSCICMYLFMYFIIIIYIFVRLITPVVPLVWSVYSPASQCCTFALMVDISRKHCANFGHVSAHVLDWIDRL